MLFHVVVVSVRTQWNQVFRRSFNDDSYLIISLTRDSWKQTDSCHSFKVLVERKLSKLLLEKVTVNKHRWYINLVIKQKLDNSNLKGLTLWLILVIVIIMLHSDICIREQAVDN